uniref:Uncharacterized protein n=1 Tax=Setaria viridis TaxID=4556 RepID=A0A4U6U501_SETVI|nr:hypothetical protein SEVIR_6G079600v2 [Setaria viridis]
MNSTFLSAVHDMLIWTCIFHLSSISKISCHLPDHLARQFGPSPANSQIPPSPAALVRGCEHMQVLTSCPGTTTVDSGTKMIHHRPQHKKAATFSDPSPWTLRCKLGQGGRSPPAKTATWFETAAACGNLAKPAGWPSPCPGPWTRFAQT